MKKILIYSGAGTSAYSVNSMVHSLSMLGIHKTHEIQKISKDFFIQPSWEESCALLIFPGGRDLPYVEALSNGPMDKIKNYVEEGGKYLGVCAGAYFACDSIEFAKGGPLEVTGERALKFFPGKGIGPAIKEPVFSYGHETGACIAKLKTTHPSYNSCGLYFNGGCFFQNDPHNASFETLAQYEDVEETPSAIVKCQVKKGLAILSGVHPEFSALHEEAKALMREDIYNSLIEQESARSTILSDIFKALLEE
jgi:biotin--protein ligase